MPCIVKAELEIRVAADAEAALRMRASPVPHGLVSAAGDKPNRIGQAFTFAAVAKLSGGAIARRTKVIRLTGNPADPILVLAIE